MMLMLLSGSCPLSARWRHVASSPLPSAQACPKKMWSAPKKKACKEGLGATVYEVFVPRTNSKIHPNVQLPYWWCLSPHSRLLSTAMTSHESESRSLRHSAFHFLDTMWPFVPLAELFPPIMSGPSPTLAPLPEVLGRLVWEGPSLSTRFTPSNRV